MIPRFIPVILITTVLLTGCSSTADDYITESNKFAEKGNYKKAIELIDKALEKDNNHRGAYLNRGLCNEKIKDFKAAIADYQKLLYIDPKNTAALYSIGTCKHDLNLFQEAIDYYNKALATKGYHNKNDTSTPPIFILERNKNEIYEEAKFDIRDDEIFYRRALAYYQVNDFRNSYQDFYICLLHSYYPKDCQYMMALCFIESGDKKKGCAELDKAIAMGDTMALRKKQELCK